MNNYKSSDQDPKSQISGSIGAFMAAALTQKQSDEAIFTREHIANNPAILDLMNTSSPKRKKAKSPEPLDVEINEPEIAISQPVTVRKKQSLEKVYGDSVNFLRAIESHTKTHVRKLIRRINKLKRYSQTKADIRQQRDIIQKRIDKSLALLIRLEKDRDEILEDISILAEERQKVTSELYENPDEQEYSELIEICVRFNASKKKIDMIEPEIQQVRKAIEQMQEVILSERNSLQVTNDQIANDIEAFQDSLEKTLPMQIFAKKFQKLDQKLNQLFELRKLNELDRITDLLRKSKKVKIEDDDQFQEEEDDFLQ